MDEKIDRNRRRDKEEQQKLAKMGWHVIVIWECQLKSDKKEKTLESLIFTLNHIYIEDHSIAYPRIESEMEIAAEPLGKVE